MKKRRDEIDARRSGAVRGGTSNRRALIQGTLKWVTASLRRVCAARGHVVGAPDSVDVRPCGPTSDGTDGAGVSDEVPIGASEEDLSTAIHEAHVTQADIPESIHRGPAASIKLETIGQVYRARRSVRAATSGAGRREPRS
jgi:hypothetical protein